MLRLLSFRRNFWNCVIFYFFLYRSNGRISRFTPVCCTAYEGSVRAAVTWWMVLPSMSTGRHVQHLTQVLTQLDIVFLAYSSAISFSFFSSLCYSFYTWLSLCSFPLFIFIGTLPITHHLFIPSLSPSLIFTYLLPSFLKFSYILLLPQIIPSLEFLTLNVSIFSWIFPPFFLFISSFYSLFSHMFYTMSEYKLNN